MIPHSFGENPVSLHARASGNHPSRPSPSPHDPSHHAATLRAHYPHNPLIQAAGSFAAWRDGPAPVREWLVEGLIPMGAVTFLSGDGGLGKSHLALQLMMAAALGLPWLGRKTMAVRSVGLFCEDDEDELERRAKAMARRYCLPVSDIRMAGANFVAQPVGDTRLVEFYALYDKGRFGARREVYEATALHGHLVEWAKAEQARLVVLDSLHDFFFDNENSRPIARAFVAELRRIAQEIDGAVLVLAHPSLNGMHTGTGSSGSTAWNNAVRSRLYLNRALPPPGMAPDDSLRVLRTVKSNYARVGEVARLRWVDGAFVEDAPMTPDEATALRHREAFLEALAQATEQGRNVSEHATAANYAPRLLRAYPCCRAFTLAELAAAMQALLAEGLLARRAIGRKADRHHFITLVARDPNGDPNGPESNGQDALSNESASPEPAAPAAAAPDPAADAPVILPPDVLAQLLQAQGNGRRRGRKSAVTYLISD